MTTPTRATGRTLADRLASRPEVWGFVAVMAIAAVRLLTDDEEWLSVYVTTARHLLAGRDIYEQPHGYTYPPFPVLLAVPFVSLGDVARRVLWFALNVVAMAATLRLTWRLAGGGPLGRDTARKGDRLAACLGLLAGLPFLLNSLVHQQTDVILVALVLAGVALIVRRAPAAGAVPLGLAAAIKATPLLFAPYLLWRGRVAAAAVVVAVALGASVLPDLVHRPADGHRAWLSKWADRYLSPMARETYTPGVWASDVIYNQSIAGALNRWTQTTWRFASGTVQVVAQAGGPTTAALRWTWLGAVGVLVSVTAAAMLVARRRGLSWEERVPWECAMVMVGMVLYSPMSSPAHFGVLLLPGCLLARAVIVDRRFGLLVPLAVMVAVGAAANKDLVGRAVSMWHLWYGLTMWSAVAALFGCAAALMTHHRRT